LCFVMIVFNSDYVLGESLRSILPFGPLVVTAGPCGYWREAGYKTSTDNTNNILDAHRDFGRGIIDIVHGQFSEKDEMMNATAHLVPEDTTHVFMVDSDEVWRKRDIEKIIGLLENGRYDSVGFTADSFFGGFDYILGGFERDFEVIRIQRWYKGARWATHRPPTVLSPLGQPWATQRHLGAKETLQLGITMPHYSYVFPSQVAMKHVYYSHYAPGITIPNYPDEVFLPWVMGDEKKRAEIEEKWSGVHNFVPQYRGPCFTMPFNGEHPKEIENNIEELKDRIAREVLGFTEAEAMDC